MARWGRYLAVPVEYTAQSQCAEIVASLRSYLNDPLLLPKSISEDLTGTKLQEKLRKSWDARVLQERHWRGVTEAEICAHCGVESGALKE